MRVVVAGSRTIDDFDLVARAVVESGFALVEAVSGAVKGVDLLGECFAEEHSLTVRRFETDWRRQGRGAGRTLNEAMTAHANALIAVDDGSPGTADMGRRMHAAGKPVHEVVTPPKVSELEKAGRRPAVEPETPRRGVTRTGVYDPSEEPPRRREEASR